MAPPNSKNRAAGKGATRPTPADILLAIAAMAGEAAVVQLAVKGSITNILAGWVAGRYAEAASEHLAGLDGEARLKVMHTFAQDWALLRKGDQAAERLEIERDRLKEQAWMNLEKMALAKREALDRYKRKIVVGVETLMTLLERKPEAKAAFDAFWEQVRNPFDPDEKVPPGGQTADAHPSPDTGGEPPAARDPSGPIQPDPTKSDL